MAIIATRRGREPPNSGGVDSAAKYRSIILASRHTKHAEAPRFMPQDLRTFLDLLIRTYPEQLKVVSSEVKPEFEATALVDRIEDDPAHYPGFPAVLFRNVGGASMPLLLNLHATYERLALSIGTDVKGMVPEYAKREGTRIPTVTVDSSAAT